jgi:hypothetical protein
MAIIVTNCSKRKRTAPLPALSAGCLPKGDLEFVAREWVNRVRSVKPLAEAEQLYCGRQFFLSAKTAKILQAELLVVSAGLGTVRAKSMVPAYSLTVSPGAGDSILRIVEPGTTARCWWQSLSRAAEDFLGLRDAVSLTGSAEDLILIAMPAPYLAMVEQELEHFRPEERSRTRIFTSASFQFEEESLNDLIMPYDNRVDGPSSPCPGTATDFSARALSHFVSNVLPQQRCGSHRQHAELVTQHLSGWPDFIRPERTRMSDEKLLHLIRANWVLAGGSPSEMLRFVRHKLGLACEQKRMRELHAAVRAELELAA